MTNLSTPTSLSLLLKRYRIAAGLSQEALAQRASLSTRAVSDLERGLHRAPHATTMELLASALALSPHQRALLLASARPDLAPVPDGSDAGLAVAPPCAIPLPPNRLIGREREFAQALHLLRRESRRLLTLLGPGGVGKTRLALQVAHDIAPEFRDGAVFVDLAPLQSATLVPSAIAQSLRLHVQSAQPLETQIQTYLRDKYLLLLLDNFEHVAEAALFVAELLTWCPGISLLVTSRSPLRLRGEQTIHLAPLALDDALVLFRESAHMVRPDTKFDVAEVAAICERLDCLPLGIELAASQVSVLSPAQILGQLTRHDAFALDGPKDLPARQRTIEADLAWSYDLLTASQQRCFCAMGVFVGGATLPAARMVCWGTDSVSDAEVVLTLAALVDSSLVQVEVPPGGYTRFHLLELVRAFAIDRLRVAGEEEACKRRHATYLATLSDSLMSTETGPAVHAFLLGQELPNARAALAWAEAARDAELGLRLVGFARLWLIHGAGEEARRWMSAMLALDAEARAAGLPTAPLSLRVECLYGYSRTLLNSGQMEQAEAFARESVELAHRVGDTRALSSAYATLGMVAQASGDIEGAVAAFRENVARADSGGNSEDRYRDIYFLAELARNLGDLNRSHELLVEALEGARSIDNAWDVSVMNTMLAHVERQQRDGAQARRRYIESLKRFHAFKSPAFFAWCLEGYCALLADVGRFGESAQLCAAANALRAQARAPLPESERASFDETQARARSALGDSAFDGAWAVGSSFTITSALDEAIKIG